MRKIEQSNAYKRDLKRESKGKNRNILMPFGELQVVTLTLADDILWLERLGTHSEILGL